MKATVSQKEFVSAIKMVAKAKGKNSVIPIIEEYLIKVEKEKTTVVAGDLLVTNHVFENRPHFWHSVFNQPSCSTNVVR